MQSHDQRKDYRMRIATRKLTEAKIASIENRTAIQTKNSTDAIFIAEVLVKLNNARILTQPNREILIQNAEYAFQVASGLIKIGFHTRLSQGIYNVLIQNAKYADQLTEVILNLIKAGMLTDKNLLKLTTTHQDDIYLSTLSSVLKGLNDAKLTPADYKKNFDSLIGLPNSLPVLTHLMYMQPFSQKTFDDIVQKYQQEAKMALVSALHPRLGAESQAQLLRSNSIGEPKLMSIIFSTLFGNPTNSKESKTENDKVKFVLKK